MPSTEGVVFAVVLVALSTLGASTTTVNTFVIGEVRKRDTHRPIYQIHLPDEGHFEASFNPSDDEIPPGMSAMRMVTANGQAMRCIVPESKPLQRNRNPSSPEESPANNIPEENRFDDIDDILSVYENKCFLREDGWWTYEFCYGRHIVQRHVIPTNRHPTEGEQEVEIVLGKFDRGADLERRKNPSVVSQSDAAFTQLFENGTKCDLNGLLRRAVVKYMCSEDALQMPESSASAKRSKLSNLNVLNKVRELESCVYEIEFLNSAICQHATYKEKAANAVKPIYCSVEDGGRAFEGLKTDNYQRASLSL